MRPAKQERLLLAESCLTWTAAPDPELLSVGSGMLLDAVQSGWTAALRVDGAGLARVRLSEKSARTSRPLRSLPWAGMWPLVPPFIGWPLVHPNPDVD
jgi:hypothetical protein